ncbi:MAG TPA: hypothetical protein VEB64_04845 [Azospirillaceae bacterium]|nr:hypothetical protein [Azospirillaceae bacterium]
MTPLAQATAKQRCLPAKQRTIIDPCDLLPAFDNPHCFECSEVCDLVDPLGSQIALQAEQLVFLPAPQTWIEFHDPETGSRLGALLTAVGAEGATAEFRTVMMFRDGRIVAMPEVGIIPVDQKWKPFDFKFSLRYLPPDNEKHAHQNMHYFMALLCMINTPRIIGRRQHLPHAGLQRQIARAKGMVGKFPLHAWTELKLEVRPTMVDTGEPHDAMLTGGRALHFCRAHLRVRLGRLELVHAHWRGDPALGMRQTRHKLVPPKK